MQSKQESNRTRGRNRLFGFGIILACPIFAMAGCGGTTPGDLVGGADGGNAHKASDASDSEAGRRAGSDAGASDAAVSSDGATGNCAATCSGCCDGETCVAKPTDDTCGLGGIACENCRTTGPLVCVGGSCVAKCDAFECSNGCCTADNACHTTDSLYDGVIGDTLCPTQGYGAACADCTKGTAGQTSCIPPFVPGGGYSCGP